MTFDDPRRLLRLARDWKRGDITPVHPSVGRMLNHVLIAYGEDAVPFGRATNSSAPSLADLVRAEHGRAPAVTSDNKRAAARRFADQMSASVHRGTHVGGG